MVWDRKEQDGIGWRGWVGIGRNRMEQDGGDRKGWDGMGWDRTSGIGWDRTSGIEWMGGWVRQDEWDGMDKGMNGWKEQDSKNDRWMMYRKLPQMATGEASTYLLPQN